MASVNLNLINGTKIRISSIYTAMKKYDDDKTDEIDMFEDKL